MFKNEHLKWLSKSSSEAKFWSFIKTAHSNSHVFHFFSSAICFQALSTPALSNSANAVLIPGGNQWQPEIRPLIRSPFFSLMLEFYLNKNHGAQSRISSHLIFSANMTESSDHIRMALDQGIRGHIHTWRAARDGAHSGMWNWNWKFERKFWFGNCNWDM